MKKQQKIEKIMSDIGYNYSGFLKQAQIKLYKRSHLLESQTDHIELVSDIIFSIVDKLDNFKSVNRYYRMVKENTLQNYIYKSIDTNCSSFNAPFLRKKVKSKNQLYIDREIKDEDCQIDSIFNSNKEDVFLDEFYKRLKPKEAKRIFGDQWKYFVDDIILKYIKPDMTYKKIADEIDVPLSSIYVHFRYAVNKIIKDINNENT